MSSGPKKFSNVVKTKKDITSKIDSGIPKRPSTITFTTTSEPKYSGRSASLPRRPSLQSFSSNTSTTPNQPHKLGQLPAYLRRNRSVTPANKYHESYSKPNVASDGERPATVTHRSRFENSAVRFSVGSEHVDSGDRAASQQSILEIKQKELAEMSLELGLEREKVARLENELSRQGEALEQKLSEALKAKEMADISTEQARSETRTLMEHVQQLESELKNVRAQLVAKDRKPAEKPSRIPRFVGSIDRAAPPGGRK